MAHVLLTNLHTSGRKLNANRWLRFRTEFISSKAGEKVRFPNTRVADQNHFEKVIITAVGQVIRTNARFWSQTNSSEATNLTRRYLLTSSQARRLPVSKSESEYLRAQFFNGCTMLEDDCLREWCLDIVVVTSSHHGLRRHLVKCCEGYTSKSTTFYEGRLPCLLRKYNPYELAVLPSYYTKV